MGKFKDIWNGEHRSFIRYAAAATAVFIVYIGFLGQDNLVRWIRSGIQLRQQERQIVRYQEEIDRMDERIRRLSTDRDTLERYAREQFHFAEPGDDVYLEGK